MWRRIEQREYKNKKQSNESIKIHVKSSRSRSIFIQRNTFEQREKTTSEGEREKKNQHTAGATETITGPERLFVGGGVEDE